MKSIQYAAKFEYLDEIRDFVADIARRAGFNDRDVYNIQLATDEAASNIIEHAYEGISNGVLELSCGMMDDSIKIVLTDHGEPYDPESIPMPDLKADLSERKIGGLGIFLMRKLMDTVHYESRPEINRNTLTMTKRRS